MESLVRIGCGAGFAGDRADASAAVIAELARCTGPRFLMFETLAERTLALCQLERRQNPARGYSPALERMLPPALGPCLANGIRIVGNFGGAHPSAAGARVAQLARAAGFPNARIAVVEGDDLSEAFSADELIARSMARSWQAARRSSPPTCISGPGDAQASTPAPTSSSPAGGRSVAALGRSCMPSAGLDRLAQPRGGHARRAPARTRRAGDRRIFRRSGREGRAGAVRDRIRSPKSSAGAFGDRPRGTGGIVDRRTVTEQILYGCTIPPPISRPTSSSISATWSLLTTGAIACR